MSVVIFGFLFSKIGLFFISDESFDEAQRLLDVPIFEMKETLPTPNVYLILLDAYSGNILLEEDFGYDNSKVFYFIHVIYISCTWFTRYNWIYR